MRDYKGRINSPKGEKKDYEASERSRRENKEHIWKMGAGRIIFNPAFNFITNRCEPVLLDQVCCDAMRSSFIDIKM